MGFPRLLVSPSSATFRLYDLGQMCARELTVLPCAFPQRDLCAWIQLALRTPSRLKKPLFNLFLIFRQGCFHGAIQAEKETRERAKAGGPPVPKADPISTCTLCLGTFGGLREVVPS